MKAAKPRGVLFLLDYFPGPYAGTELQFWLLVNGLNRRKFAPFVGVLRPSTQLSEYLGGIGYRVLGVSRLSRPSSWLTAFRVAWWARRNGYRVAHLFLNDVSILFPWPLRLLGVRVIVSRRDVGFWYSPGILRVLRLNRHAVAKIVANSSMVRAAVCEHERYGLSKVDVIHNGVPSSDPRLAPVDLPAIPARSGAYVLGLVANLRRLKRIEDAIRVVHGLTTGGLDVELVVAGSYDGAEASSYKTELEALARELGIADRIRFLGRVQGARAVLQRCDVCLMCSESEGMPNALLESLSVGRATVSTRVGGVEEIVEEGVSGFLVAVGDTATMTRQTAALLRDPALREQVGKAAALRANTHFSVEQMIRAHEQLYDGLA